MTVRRNLFTVAVIYTFLRSDALHITRSSIIRRAEIAKSSAKFSSLKDFPNTSNGRFFYGDSLVESNLGAASQKFLNNFVKFCVTNFLLFGSSKYSFAETQELPAATVEEPTDIFVQTESGLRYKDTKVGTGEQPVPGDTVRVHYTGWLDDFESEKKFDSSYDRRSPLVFKVGVKQVIAGWDEALLTNMKVGGKRDIIIPSTLGYGSRGAGGVIPPNATLYFKIELVGIGAKPNK